MAVMVKAFGKQSCRAWAAEPGFQGLRAVALPRHGDHQINDNTDSGTDVSRSPRMSASLGLSHLTST